MYDDTGPIFFIDELRITLNRDDSPLFIMADYGTRSWQVNMEFQHYHNFHEIFIPLDPGQMHLLDGKCVKLEKFDMVLLRPGLRHMSIYPKDRPSSRRILIDFRLGNSLPGLDYQIGKLLGVFQQETPVYRFSGEGLNAAARELNRFFITGTSKPNGWQVQLYSDFLSFLLTFLRYPSVYSSEDSMDSIEQKIYLVNAYINDHYKERLSLGELAGRFAISPSYLSHQFSNINGTSLVDYIHNVRVRAAASALYFSKDPIKKVMKDTGFESISQFNRVFKELTELSPTGFRQSSPEKKSAILQALDPESREKDPAAVSPRSRKNLLRSGRKLIAGFRAEDASPSTPEALKTFVQKHGIETMQLSVPACFSHKSYSELSERETEDIRRQGFSISVLDSGIDLASPGEKEWEASLSEFSTALRIASYLGAKAVSARTGSCEEASRGRQFARVVEALERLLPYAAQYGVPIAIEPSFTDTINTPEQMKRLLDLFHTDYLKVIFDPVGLLGPELENNRQSFFESALSCYGSHIAAMRVRDCLSTGPVSLGHGVMDKVYPRLTAFLPYGIAAIREAPGIGTLEEDLRYIRSFSS